MMSDTIVRIDGRTGHITLNRPKALNALSHPMCTEIETALDTWRDDPAVAVVILDAEGDRAFCAGGDIAQIYHSGRDGDFALGRDFWREEYRLNAKIAEYPKPIVSFLTGFVMGGGVGIGCLGSHRIVGESTQMAMPECGIGLIPDVGGTFRLAHAPGRAGDYLGLTGARMGPGDAIYARFADTFVPEADWPALKAALAETGDAATIAAHARPVAESRLAALEPQVDRLFAGATVSDILAALDHDPGEFAAEATKALRRNSPLSMAVTLTMIRSPAAAESVRTALTQEFRATWRLLAEGDFLEGVRAQIIDKDRNPKWKHSGPAAVTTEEVAATLAPLGSHELKLEEEL